MHVTCLTTLDELKPYADDWDRLATGSPFRGWTWLSCWWRNYGPQKGDNSRRHLATLCVFNDADALIGVAPWHLDDSTVWGHVLRPLGDGEVCSDYLGVLCHPADENSITEALADYLVANAMSDDVEALHWDLLDLDGIDAGNHAVSALVGRLTALRCELHEQAGPNCWRLPLPTDWERYVASLGRNLRRDVRQLERNYWDSGRVVLHSVHRLDELPAAMDILIDLHSRRRASLGEKGCFASARFLAFFHEVMPELLRQGRLQLHWLDLDGRPVAAECLFLDGGILYMYQGGIDPTATEHQPGKLIQLAIVRQAIEGGVLAFDFLRGDEPYKARFGARPRPSVHLRLVPPRPLAKLRHRVWLAGRNVKEWVKRGASGRSAAASTQCNVGSENEG
jgi:CelD/BcsL family acetyltransferase involved in cellulose biosynthesis